MRKTSSCVLLCCVALCSHAHTLFPVLGLLSQAGFEMFYVKPGRYFPRKTKVRDVFHNLVYVMNTMLEKENPCKNGIG